ncbi:hypothetical protein, partial [Sporofaciens musculi]|uniref:hypothetical protein n=1 Tax=Sporofaciens musculi TaxID=2681861 RepID=UPI002570C972
LRTLTIQNLGKKRMVVMIFQEKNLPVKRLRKGMGSHEGIIKLRGRIPPGRKSLPERLRGRAGKRRRLQKGALRKEGLKMLLPKPFRAGRLGRRIARLKGRLVRRTLTLLAYLLTETYLE